MNEALQSTNEERFAVNEEQRQSTDALNNTNALLRSVRTGLRSGAAVVNQKLNCTSFVTGHRASHKVVLTKEVVSGL